MILGRYKATVTRTAARFATCEKCGCEYTFTATATGSAERGLMIGMGRSLRKDADDAALIDANSKVLVVPAPCPDCGWYQQWMVPELRRLHNGWMRKSGQALLAFAGVGVFLALRGYGEMLEGQELRATIGAAALGGILLGMHWSLAAKHDPNAAFPKRPPLREGEPQTKRTPAYQARLEAERAAADRPEWFYILRSKQDKLRRGPVSRARLVAMLHERSLGPEDWTWCEGMADWLPARQALS